MKRFKVASYIALSHLSKLVVNLFILKQIAVLYGPEGMGFLGNFMTLITLATTLAGGGIVSGVIKYVAEYSKNSERLLPFLGSALIYTVASSLLILILGLLFANNLTEYIFLDSKYKEFIYFFLLIQFFIALNNFAFGVSNGMGQTRVYAIFSIGGNLIAAAIAYFAIPVYGLWGAIIAIAAPAFSAFIPLVFYFMVQRISLKKYMQFHSVIHDSRLLSKYSLMLVCSAICFPIVEMIIRNMIVTVINVDAAGYWQAITRFSSAYLSFYSLLLSFYFVPIISAADNADVIYEQVKKMIVFILFLFIPMMIFFYFFKNTVIQYIFSTNFLPVADLFFLQMVGDLFRVIGWVIGFIIVAKALSGLYILGEIVQASLFIGLSSIQLTHTNELNGVVFAYMSTCIIYCILLLIVSYYIFYGKRQAWIINR
ncbi:MAG: O-antigen translocase [Legionella sp.]|nr:O-antigen translocase [Legionella sp.]